MEIAEEAKVTEGPGGQTGHDTSISHLCSASDFCVSLSFLLEREKKKKRNKAQKTHQAFAQANNASNLNIVLAVFFLLYTVGSDLRDQFYFLGGVGMPGLRAKCGS